jgi:hypothetical membrane protein
MRTRLSMKPLAAAGIVGPIGFIILVVIQGVIQPDFDHIAMPISALAAWPAGWLQNLNFFVFGALMAAFAIGVNDAIRRTRFGFLGIALLLANSLGIFMAGLFPWISVNGVPEETPEHVVAAVLTFSSASIGLAVLSRRMAADPLWHDLSAYVFGTGLVMLALFIAVGGFAIEEGTPLHGWAGLLQRALVVVWFACLLVVARRALGLNQVVLVNPTMSE